VARSHDLASAFFVVGGLLVLMWLGGDLVRFLGTLTRNQLGTQVSLAINADVATERWNATLLGLGRVVLPVLGLLAFWAVAGHVGQIGFLFLPHRLIPDGERLQPSRGFQRVFSSTNLASFLSGILQTSVVAVVAAWGLWGERQRLVTLGELDVGPLAVASVEIAWGVCLKAALALVVLGIADYAYQRWKYVRELRMTVQELREELKHLQGVRRISPRLLQRPPADSIPG
jgi:flagellar biosynthetic protein FlhB